MMSMIMKNQPCIAPRASSASFLAAISLSNGRLAATLGLSLVVGLLCGCTTVTIYQSPVADFQTAVNTANNSIRPYLTEVNSLIAKANLYDKVGLGKPWGTEDLKAGIPPHEIDVRLKALAVIASYANALGTVANAKDVEALSAAAKTLGDDVNGLKTSVAGLAVKRAPTSLVAKQAATLDLSGPISSLVTLFGTMAVEYKQKQAVEKAILDGEKPVGQLLDLLKTDLQALTFVDDASYASIQTGMVSLYGQARGKTDPMALAALIDKFIADNARVQTLRSLDLSSLLSDMKSAHLALVTFAKSSKTPKDLSDLAAQISVLTAHVKLVNEAVTSVQSAVNATK